MPDLDLMPSLNFDRGIDSVSYLPRQALARQMPERQDLPPVGDGAQSRLADLLYPPGLDDFLIEQLHPRDLLQNILRPSSFGHALEAIPARMRAAAAGLPAAKAKADALRQAARLLDQDIRNRELLDKNRLALLQG